MLTKTLGDNFSKEVSLALQRKKKKLTIFIVDGKIQASGQKSEFWKPQLWHQESENFPALNTITMKAAVVLYNFLKVHNKKCQHLKDLHESVNQCFLTTMHRLKKGYLSTKPYTDKRFIRSTRKSNNLV